MSHRRPQRNDRRFSGFAWTPGSLPNLVGWYESDYGVTVVGGSVSAWSDRSAAGNHLTQGTAGQRPTFNAQDAGYNGRPSISFTASSSTCLTTSAISYSQPLSYIYCCNITNANGSLIDGSTANYNNVYFDQYTRMFAGSPGLDDTTGTSFATKQVGAAVFNGASSAIYANNSQAAEASGSCGAKPVGTWSIGGAVGGSGDPFAAGTLVALIIVNGVPSAADMRSAFLYLGNKYGKTTS